MSNLRQLKVTFGSFDDLIESIGPGLSRTRLVIPRSALRVDNRVNDAIGEGTRVRLEIGTVRKGALIRGVAKVVEGEDACDQDLPLHVIHLDPSSTRVVDSIVRGEGGTDEEPGASGHSPFDIPAAEPEPVVEPVVLETDDLLPGASPTRDSAWPIIVGMLGALVLLCFLILRPSEGTGSDSQAEMADPPTQVRSDTQPVTVASVVNDPAAEDGSSIDRESLSSEKAVDEVEATIRAWADAWARQAPDAYLDFYAFDYSPDSLTRDAWESQRRLRITAPQQLEVRLDELEIERLGQDRAVARFQQLYATEKKALLAQKVLELERSEAGWKIVSERLASDQ